ncbi:putative ribonuclease H-like domain-containing protein [Tanacetum coccineum]
MVPRAVLMKFSLVSVNTARQVNAAHSKTTMNDQGVTDSGCSRHMTMNMYYEEIDGGYVAFGGNPKGGKITGKGTIKTSNLDFENVYFVRELKFNLFSVSQMCDKKNSVLFNDTECIVLSPNFKLIDESQVLLRVPRKNNMYSVDLKNIVPKRGLTCLFTKATSDESKLWHRRLGHLNFKTMNKLVKGNLVRGLPFKLFENDQTCVACQKGKQHKASLRDFGPPSWQKGKTKERSSQSHTGRLNFGPEDEVSPPRHRKERRRKDNRRPPVFGRIGKQVSGTQTANLQNLDTHENNDRRITSAIGWAVAWSNSRLGQWPLPVVKVLKARTSRTSLTQAPQKTTIENWPQPVWATFHIPRYRKQRRLSANYHAEALRFEELRRAFAFNFNSKKVHTYHECVQLRSANCQIGPRKADWITVKNLKEGKDKQRAGGKTDAPRDKA